MTLHDAQEIAQKWIIEKKGPEFAIFPGALAENDCYFVFAWNTKRFVETKGRRHALIGPGPVVVDKRDGRVFEHASCCFMSPMEALLDDQSGYAERESIVRRRFPDYDMRKSYRVLIRKVHDHRRPLEMLDSFQMHYVIPEVEAGAIWRIAKQYDKELLEKRLAGPVPIDFGGAGSLEPLYELLVSDAHDPLCEIDIEEVHELKRTHDPSNAKPEDLQPEW